MSMPLFRVVLCEDAYYRPALRPANPVMATFVNNAGLTFCWTRGSIGRTFSARYPFSAVVYMRSA